ncbi:MAG: hypothetical protein R3B84_19780 [Zavarzinella sp.]
MLRSILLVSAILSIATPAHLIAQVGRLPKLPAKIEVPDGYKKLNYGGFTLLVNEQAVLQDARSRLERKPLEALEKEFQIVEKVVPTDKLKILQQVPIWVEWDEQLMMSNGRAGGALAVFMGGHQANLAMNNGGKVSKINAVTVLSLKNLAEEHQPATDSDRCVTLHELAHAYHFFQVGMENSVVTNTHKQAMERKLYDPKMYAATNPAEYCAELTCAYLDRLSYFPRDRRDLQKHDAEGFKMMQRYWGVIADSGSTGAKLPSANADGRFSLAIDGKKIRIGRTVVGPELTPEQRELRPTVYYMFHPDSEASLVELHRFSVLERMVRKFSMNSYMVLSSQPARTDPAVLRQRFGIKAPVVERVMIPFPEDTFALPHCMIFNHEDKCVFRGSLLDAERHMYLAIGEAAIARSKVGKMTRKAEQAAAILRSAQDPDEMLAKLVVLLRGSGGLDADQIKKMALELIEGGQQVVEQANKILQQEHVTAYLMLEPIPDLYKNTSVALKANQLMARLRASKHVQAELGARRSLVLINKLDAELSGKPMSFAPDNPEFREEHAMLLKNLQMAITSFLKAHGKTRTAEEVKKVAENWLLDFE